MKGLLFERGRYPICLATGLRFQAGSFWNKNSLDVGTETRLESLALVIKVINYEGIKRYFV